MGFLSFKLAAIKKIRICAIQKRVVASNARERKYKRFRWAPQ